MSLHPPTWSAAPRPGALARCRRVAAWLALLWGVAAFAGGAEAAPFIWDQDDNKIDDRIETVHLLGYTFAFDQGDTLLHQRIDVTRLPGNLLYGVYVNYFQKPTASDVATLTTLGMPVLYRYDEIPTLRSVATFAQVQALASLPGIERVEALPILYPMLREGAASIGVRDPSGQVFPTWSGMTGAAGQGVTVAILDTGINDQPEGSYPGHESLIGRCLGGGDFTHADSSLDTPRDGSTNPVDHGGTVTHAHGTHVAGIVLGSGGPTGYAMGVAPEARFVDVKVLDDAGVGTGVAEALDWCIHNRSRDWGAPGYAGIDVINLSLSSPDLTDGNDAASRLANRAVQLGIVVVASMGNDGKPSHVPSPAGGDGVLAVGAFDDQRTPLNGDDQFASFSNYGPRASDGDLDAADEAKPDLLAPGVAVLSADGDLLSDGAQYRRLSGTSMSAAFVSGVVAALRSADPSLGPGQIAALLRATGNRPLAGIPAGVTGAAPGWYSPIGFGAVDLHAAWLERYQPQRSQVRRLELQGEDNQITATLRTQRERGAQHFVFERGNDAGGTPGPFAPYDSVAASGDSSLADGTNLQTYTRVWNVPGAERGERFWYRVSYTEAGVRTNGPSRSFTSPVGPPIASVEVTVVHSAYDTDVSGEIEVGGAASAGAEAAPGLVFPLPATSAAASSDWVTGASAAGNVAWNFVIPIPQGAASASLPPDPTHPWRLSVTEGGFLNRNGRVTQYRVVWHGPGGDQIFQGGPLPLQTAEGVTVVASTPSGVTGIGPDAAAGGLFVAPNPVARGGTITFSVGNVAGGELTVFDVAGRQVGHAPLRPGAAGWSARWTACDGSGRPLAPGLYLARAGAANVARLVVLGR